jgi:glycine cleavage system transcriptional repressor
MANLRQVAITAIGEDHPGIVAGIAEVLFDVGGNLRDTSMTILSGEFAMILIVAVPESLNLTDLERRFDGARAKLGISVFIKALPDSRHLASQRPSEGQDLITVGGADHPGIVFRLADVVSRRGINITDLDTRVISEESNPVYLALMEILPPASADMTAITQELIQLGRDLKVEVTVRPMDGATL